MSEQPQHLDTRAVQIVCGAILVSNVILFGIGMYFAYNPDLIQSDPPPEVVRYALLAVGAAMAAFAYALRLAPIQPRQTAAIVRAAAGESPGVIGLVLALLFADVTGLAILTALAIAVGILNFPTRQWLEGR